MATAPSDHLIDIDRETGELVQGWPRIKQSIFVILTTRLRTRLMRLWWGSNFINMQDKPGNQEVLMAGMMAAIVNLWMSGQKERVPYEVIKLSIFTMRANENTSVRWSRVQFEVPPELCTSRPQAQV